MLVSNPTDFPDSTEASSRVVEIQEPVVQASIIVPEGRFMVSRELSSLVAH